MHPAGLKKESDKSLRFRRSLYVTLSGPPIIIDGLGTVHLAMEAPTTVPTLTAPSSSGTKSLPKQSGDTGITINLTTLTRVSKAEITDGGGKR